MKRTNQSLQRVGDTHRKPVLLALLWMTALAGILFGVLNVQSQLYILASAEFGMSLYSCVLIWRLRGIKHLRPVTLLFLIPFFSVMMLALLVPGTSVSIFGWVLLIPLLGHLLLGRKLGLAISLIYLGIAAVIFWAKSHGDPALIDPRSVANMVVLSVCILACSHVYELSRERSESYLALTARTDFLTGLNNRLGFTQDFERERKRAQRNNSSLAMVVVDLDHFKRINDHFGHDAGDALLCHVANTLADRLRDSDVLARLGGEEFGVLLTDTHLPQATAVAQALCDAVASRPLAYREETITVTLSAGVACLDGDSATLESLMAAADERLYQAKSAGRNRVVAAAPDPLTPDPFTPDPPTPEPPTSKTAALA